MFPTFATLHQSKKGSKNAPKNNARNNYGFVLCAAECIGRTASSI
jgi:hypothetical protein